MNSLDNSKGVPSQSNETAASARLRRENSNALKFKPNPLHCVQVNYHCLRIPMIVYVCARFGCIYLKLQT